MKSIASRGRAAAGKVCIGALTLAVTNIAPGASAARPASPGTNVATSDIVTLPEFLVEESVANRPTLYVEVPGFQFLSLGTVRETKDLVREIQRQKFLVESIVPEDFRPKHTTPMLYILDDASSRPALTNPTLSGRVADSTQQSLNAFRSREPDEIDTDAMRVDLPALTVGGVTQSTEKGPGYEKRTVTKTVDKPVELGRGRLSTGTAESSHSEFFTSLTAKVATDMDEEASYNAAWKNPFPVGSSSARDVGDGLVGKVPLFVPFTNGATQWPEWLYLTVSGALRNREFSKTSAYAVVVKNSFTEAGLTPFPPMAAFFGHESGGAGRSGISSGAARLVFGVWALLEDPARADAFWAFARQAQSAPVSEEMFKASFGFDYAGLQQELIRFARRHRSGTYSRDNKELSTTQREFAFPSMPKFPEMEPRRATRLELVRGKSEWERLMAMSPISMRGSTAMRDALLARAESRMERAYKDGLDDPQLLAQLALIEVDRGEMGKARPYLEAAAAAKAPRPRVYYELALARYREAIARPEGATRGQLSDAQVDKALEPLAKARTQMPALKGTYFLATDILLHAARKPTREDLAVLDEGARIFSSLVPLSQRSAFLHLRAGNLGDAATSVDRALRWALDLTQMSDLQKLQAALKSGERVSETFAPFVRSALQPGNGLTDRMLIRPFTPPGVSPSNVTPNSNPSPTER